MLTVDFLRGYRILIMGADSPLGEAVARALSQRGAILLLAGRNRRRLDRLAASLRAWVGAPPTGGVDIVIQALPGWESLLYNAADNHPHERLRQWLACLRPGTAAFVDLHPLEAPRPSWTRTVRRYLAQELARLRIRAFSLSLHLGSPLQDRLDALDVLLRILVKRRS